MPWEVTIPPEHKALYRALAALRLSKLQTLQAASRLTEPPESLSLPAPERTEIANEVIGNLVGFDGDAAARMLRLNAGKPDLPATWTALNSSERKRAKLLWRSALDSSLDSTPQGRPSVIDTALVLYCSRVLTEACGRDRFEFSRSPMGGPPGGPMWRALMAALPLAELFLARVDGGSAFIPSKFSVHSETIAEIVKVDRSSAFKVLCRKKKLGRTAGDVAQHPASFRIAMMRGRAFKPPSAPAR
jgi:hypothetical protein